MIDFQTDYMKDVVKDTDYSKLDLDECATMFKEWGTTRRNRSSVTATMPSLRR